MATCQLSHWLGGSRVEFRFTPLEFSKNFLSYNKGISRLADENTGPPWRDTLSNQAAPNPQGKNSSAGNELISQNSQNIAGKAFHHDKSTGSCTVPKNFRKHIKMLNTRELRFI